MEQPKARDDEHQADAATDARMTEGPVRDRSRLGVWLMHGNSDRKVIQRAIFSCVQAEWRESESAVNRKIFWSILKVRGFHGVTSSFSSSTTTQSTAIS